jgi:catechol 2,3-dioxygenase-like lactoylglutathione lyase family enzyme
MKLSTTEPWMRAADYGRRLRGLTINLIVSDIDAALVFQRDVLDAQVVYSDRDFAVLRRGAAEWMLHADHTYRDHPLGGSLDTVVARGVGAELRIHGRDPDAAEAEAHRLGFTVLDGATDKPHGLREAFILDPDGYLWVPDVPHDA